MSPTASLGRKNAENNFFWQIVGINIPGKVIFFFSTLTKTESFRERNERETKSRGVKVTLKWTTSPGHLRLATGMQ